MQIVSTITEIRAATLSARNQHERIAFVPTMGNLHEGHLSLVRMARQECDRVVVSIFVNPMQFGVGEDFASYPRTLDADCDKLTTEGVDWVFAPTDQELYPAGKDGITYIEVPELDDILEGHSRPGHFRGVATIVNKLFNIVQPDVAVFGEKDFQQLLVIRRMVKDLNIPVEVIGMPTAREADGLAMSSRNQYLSPQERSQAGTLFRTLSEIRAKIKKGERDYRALVEQASADLRASGFAVDYLEIRQGSNLQPPRPGDDELVVLVAARLGTTRLIDNLRI
jgi:pantoate--beta-alanine ligase